MSSVGEIIFVSLVLCYSIFATFHFTLPLYDHIEHNVVPPDYLDNIIQAFHKLTGYDVYSNHVYNKWLLCGLCGYVSMGLLCLLLDCLLPITFKTQASRSYFTASEWLQAVRLSLCNMFISSWTLILPLRYFLGAYPLKEGDVWDLKTEAIKFALCAVIVETWFFFTHWALHHPILYSRIHKLHHRFKAPVAVASMYAHPFEFVVGNLTGVVMGPILTHCHPFTSYVWICTSLIMTGGSHSGYKIFQADFHDNHHQYFDYNFGVGTYCEFYCLSGCTLVFTEPVVCFVAVGPLDALFGTLWVGSRKWQQLQEKQQN
jgi:sterol desaturase/sphingolipid hydroxylase (fatty acid hydroxylase superfamily)